MTMQETDPQQRLGGDAPVRFSARRAADGAAPERSGRTLPGLVRSTEFLVFAAAVIAVLAAAAIDSGFGAERAWTLVTVLAAAYIIRRR